MEIKQIIEQEQELLRSQNDIRKNFYAKVSFNQAKHIWKAIGDRFTNGNYKVDEINYDCVCEVIKWAIMDKTFQGDLHKGILIQGGVGTGKTLTIQILVEFMKYAKKIIAVYSAIEIVEIFKTSQPKDRILVSPLYIDDLGTEHVEIKVFGTPTMPIYEILNQRYLERKFLMFVTTNLSPSAVKERYGDRVADRMKEIFNIIALRGSTRRELSFKPRPNKR